MLKKLFMFPFWLLSRGVGGMYNVVKIIIDVFVWLGRFMFSRAFGALIGVIAGLLLGRKHVGIKVFADKKIKK